MTRSDVIKAADAHQAELKRYPDAYYTRILIEKSLQLVADAFDAGFKEGVKATTTDQAVIDKVLADALLHKSS